MVSHKKAQKVMVISWPVRQLPLSPLWLTTNKNNRRAEAAGVGWGIGPAGYERRSGED
jgi:hypothetical protein